MKMRLFVTDSVHIFFFVISNMEKEANHEKEI